MKIGMLFPGFGSQSVGMGKDLYDDSRIVQEHFEEASNCLNENFVKLCFASSDAELSKINNAYPALFLVSVSIAALLKEKGIVPDVVAGCDIGAFSAISSVGGLSIPDGLYLLNKYSQFYQEALEEIPEISCMRFQGVPRDVLKSECSAVSLNVAPVSIALFYNEFDHVVVGQKSSVEALSSQLFGQPGVKIDHYSAAMGLHSSLMNNVMEQFIVYLAKVDFHDVSIPFVSGVDGKVIQSGEDVKQAIVSQINHSIVMDQVLDKFNDCEIIIEVGPGGRLSSVAEKQFANKKIISVQKQSDVEGLVALLNPEPMNDDCDVENEDSIVSESVNL